MRKVLSLVLVLALILGSFSMAFAATPTDVAGTPNAEAVNVLMGLGVIDGYADGTFKPAQAVTRAEMAKLIVVALGLEDYAVGTSKFTDMAGATWAQGYVNYAAGLGVIEGYPGGTFAPTQTVSYDEAAAMIVRALGYTDDSLTGTWPTNYVVKARALGILDGIKSAVGGANRGDIAKMLYNALDAVVGYTNNEGDWMPNVATPTDANPADTMMERLGATKDTDVLIDGQEDTVINLRAHVGAMADVYYNSDGDIIMVQETSAFLTGEWDGSVFTAADVDYKLGSAVDANGADYDFFYNGDWYDDDYDLNDFASDETITIAVDLSSKTIKDLYSIGEWDVDEHDDLFTKADAKDIADDQTLFGNDFLTNDADAIDTDSFVLLGADSLDKIAVDNVVYVYDGDYVRQVAVGTKLVSGKITKISSDGKLTIGGTVYSFADQTYLDVDATDFDATDSVDLRLDYFGKIYAADLTDSATNFAIALDSADGDDALGGADTLIELYLADGTDKVFVADASTEDVVGLGLDWEWDTHPTPGQIYEYGLDKDGVLSALTAPETTYTTDEAITAKGYYDGYAFAADAVIWTYDDSYEDESNPDAYGTTTLANVKDTDLVDAYYVTDSGKIVAMLIVSSITSNDTYGVVTDWAETDTDAGYEISFLIDGVAKTYVATSAAYNDLNPVSDLEAFNELYLLSFNSAGEVVQLDIESYYDYMDYPTVDGNVVIDGSTELTLDSPVVVYVWNATDEVFEVGDVNDIEDAEDVYLYDVVDTDSVIDTVLVDADGDMYWY